MAWNRIVGAVGEELDAVVYSLDHLDNLDLFLYEASDLNTPVASSTSIIDNVEHIYYSVPQQGSYVLGIKMNGAQLGDSETYGLAWHTLTELPGDFDEDGDVDAFDFADWQADFPYPPPPEPVPEPAALALLIMGGIALVRRGRRAAKRN